MPHNYHNTCFVCVGLLFMTTTHNYIICVYHNRVLCVLWQDPQLQQLLSVRECMQNPPPPQHQPLSTQQRGAARQAGRCRPAQVLLPRADAEQRLVPLLQTGARSDRTRTPGVEELQLQDPARQRVRSLPPALQHQVLQRARVWEDRQHPGCVSGRPLPAVAGDHLHDGQRGIHHALRGLGRVLQSHGRAGRLPLQTQRRHLHVLPPRLQGMAHSPRRRRHSKVPLWPSVSYPGRNFIWTHFVWKRKVVIVEHSKLFIYFTFINSLAFGDCSVVRFTIVFSVLFSFGSDQFSATLLYKILCLCKYFRYRWLRYFFHYFASIFVVLVHFIICVSYHFHIFRLPSVSVFCSSVFVVTLFTLSCNYHPFSMVCPMQQCGVWLQVREQLKNASSLRSVLVWGHLKPTLCKTKRHEPAAFSWNDLSLFSFLMFAPTFPGLFLKKNNCTVLLSETHFDELVLFHCLFIFGVSWFSFCESFMITQLGSMLSKLPELQWSSSVLFRLLRNKQMML